MRKDPTRNTRAAKYRAASKTAGGVRVDVQIGPEAAAVLARMRASGMTVRQAVEAALVAFASPPVADANSMAMQAAAERRARVLEMFNRGMSRKEIAAEIGVSYGRVLQLLPKMKRVYDDEGENPRWEVVA